MRINSGNRIAESKQICCHYFNMLQLNTKGRIIPNHTKPAMSLQLKGKRVFQLTVRF